MCGVSAVISLTGSPAIRVATKTNIRIPKKRGIKYNILLVKYLAIDKVHHYFEINFLTEQVIFKYFLSKLLQKFRFSLCIFLEQCPTANVIRQNLEDIGAGEQKTCLK